MQADVSLLHSTSIFPRARILSWRALEQKLHSLATTWSTSLSIFLGERRSECNGTELLSQLLT